MMAGKGDFMKITYVTGNWAKLKSAKMILEPLGFEIDNKKIDCPEFKQILLKMLQIIIQNMQVNILNAIHSKMIQGL